MNKTEGYRDILCGVRYINRERERKNCFKTKKEKIVKGFKNVQTF